MDDTISTISRMTAAQRREWGSFYTPSPIVNFMAESCLRGALRQRGRILDPACGDGMFLIGAAQELASGRRLRAAGRLEIVRRRLFGVDVDSAAIADARRRLSAWIAPHNDELAAEANRVLGANLRVGNSLIGADFTASSAADDGFCWRNAFPHVADAGGFDLVLGNPPYRRELAAKTLFDTIADTPLGRQWRQPRMDLWYYFLHRGLDLLKPDGRLCFIVNSYWTASRGAVKMIERLQRETTLEEVLLLGNRKIFDGVAGRHMILRLRKSIRRRSCRVVSLENPDREFPRSHRDVDSVAEVHEIEQADLDTAGRLTLSPSPGHAAVFDDCRRLGDEFDTAQGMAENPPRINRRLAAAFDGAYEIGEGVFVLTHEEVGGLHLNSNERRLLRPYFETSALDRFAVPGRASHQVLYLTRDTAPSLERLPNISRHLSRFRRILERRRETRAGHNAWWHLHWPRRERIFTEPAVLSLQMGRVPRFVFAAAPTYVGFSVNLILEKSPGGLSLEALTGILNSAVAADWFARHAKRRGVNLELNLNVLRQFPLPPRDERRERQLAKLVDARQANGPPARCAQQEARIDKIVAGLYGITAGLAR